MKPDYEPIPYQPGNSFLVRTVHRESRTNLKGAWHFHPEYEICFTLKSKGKRFAGIDIENYEEGDLVLLGPNLPHCWITNEETEQVVVQFKADFLGKDFFESVECQSIKRLLKKANNGLLFSSSAAAQAEDRLLKIRHAQGFSCLVLLLEILQLLAEDTQCRVLTKVSPSKKGYVQTSRKIEQLYSYVLANMQKDISLDEAARHMSMCKSTLCNFLKYNIQKTFSEIVNDIRVAHAARQLQETDMTVQEVCYDAGYKDPSYFYRVFQQRMGMTPRKYKIRYLAA